ncbi:glutaredoxin family protein [Candidatus Azambacteria bacterium]|nr:glutaredoxin family protein [Candidatus Azambacteria bacterium]
MAKITIYTTLGCVFCRRAKDFLDERKIPYTEKDVTDDHEARHEMIEKSGQLGVPVIEVDGEIIVGYNRPRLSELLEEELKAWAKSPRSSA